MSIRDKIAEVFEDNFSPIRYTDNGGKSFYVNMEVKEAVDALEALIEAERIDELERYPSYPEVWNPDCLCCAIKDKYRLNCLATLKGVKNDL